MLRLALVPGQATKPPYISSLLKWQRIRITVKFRSPASQFGHGSHAADSVRRHKVAPVP